MTTQNIISVYNLSTVTDRQQGESWYADAYDFALQLSGEYNVGRLIVSGVIAALSPRNRWERNMQDAENMVKAAAAGATFDDLMDIKVCTFKNNKIKAAKILTLPLIDRHDAKIEEILSGPKMVEFYHCIQCLDDVCIDGHAYAIWMGDRITLANVPSIGVKLRRTIKADYREAAKILGCDTYVVQAVTWCAWRRIHGVTK